MSVVLPGDVIRVRTGQGSGSSSASAVRLGPGLVRGLRDDASTSSRGESSAETLLVATRAGVVGAVGQIDGNGKGKATGAGASIKGKGVEGRWVEGDPYRYTPQVGDSVVCQITNRNPETYLVTLLTSYHPCTLPVLSFEGATKRSKPDLKVGTLLYARTGKSDGLGPLRVSERDEGLSTIFKTSLGLATSLLSPSHPLLPALAAHFPFEAAVGHNGIVWVRAGSPRELIAFGKVLRAADEVRPAKAAPRKKAQQEDMMDADEPAAEGLTAQEIVKNRGLLSEQQIKHIIKEFVA